MLTYAPSLEGGTGNDKQLNIELKVDNTERGYLLQLSVMIAILGYSRYDDYQKYMINFSSARMQGSWVRYTISAIYEGKISLDRACAIMLQALYNDTFVADDMRFRMGTLNTKTDFELIVAPEALFHKDEQPEGEEE